MKSLFAKENPGLSAVKFRVMVAADSCYYIAKNKIKIRFGKHYQASEKCLSILNLRGVK